MDEVDWKPPRATVKKRVVIVGAGIAGMEAAWVAAARGHLLLVGTPVMIADTLQRWLGQLRQPHGLLLVTGPTGSGKSTTLAASWYNYKNASNRPNFTTPRDYYTDWIRAGKPAWNPVTRLVTLANGTVLGNGNVPGSTTPYTANPSFFTGGAESRSPFLIGARGESPYWTMARYTANPSSPAGNNFSVTDPFASSASGSGALRSQYSSLSRPSFASRSAMNLRLRVG